MIRRTIKSIFQFSIASLLFASSVVFAQVAITDITVKTPVPGQTVGAGYFSLANLGDEPKTLVAVSSESVERIEMHTHVHNHHDGTMSMVEMESVDIPANAVLRFEPGKNHLMLFTPNEQAMASGEIDLLFTFEDGESLTATAAVEGWK